MPELPLPPAVPRQAATVLLLRDRDGGGVEVYMQHRHRGSSFAADAYVFPGGAVDDEDGRLDLKRLAPGFDQEAAAVRMELEPGDGVTLCAALHVAAVREVLEETGILLGARNDGSPLGATDAVAIAAVRSALLEGRPLAAALDGAGLRITPESLVYVAHFITPERVPKRFDTRFLATRAPLDQEAAIHPAEATHGGWYAPAEMLERHGGDDVALMPPTRILCAELAGHPGVDAALADLGSRDVAHILFSADDVMGRRLPERLPRPEDLVG